MLLLQRLDFIGLMGLLVQAFLAWVFVAILATLRRGAGSRGAIDRFFFAFVALAVSLTGLSVRFVMSHDIEGFELYWDDGQFAPTTCYVLYQGLKGVFGLLLVRGSYELVDRRPPPWLDRVAWPVIALLAASPLVIESMPPLLMLQAPVMVACAILAVQPLSNASLQPEADVNTGRRVVRWSLAGLAIAWSIDGLAAGLNPHVPAMRYVLAANSFLDLGVQLSLGTGLVISLLQEAHRRTHEAEQERERLQRQLERDEKLRALGTLLSGVAHELNNPLTVILGYADLLASTDEDNEAATIVAEQAQRCRGIVRNLSALSSQSQHPLQELSAADLVDRVVRGIRQGRDANAPRIHIAPMDGLRLCADRIGMEQVLANLLTNAIHASPPGGVVTIAATIEPEGFVFTVTDEGPGVPPELRTRLFEPFFTTKGPGKGTGLGLSIAHAIVRAHGGSISVERAPSGRGARFSVLIPHATPGAADHPRGAAASASGRRLLVIDDEPRVRSVVRRQAESRGWIVSEADSAESALSLVPPIAEFSAVLCDLRMPGIGGAGLHDRLRNNAPTVLDRTVFVTGDLASEDAVEFADRCARPLVQKPFEFDELFTLLSSHPAHTESDSG